MKKLLISALALLAVLSLSVGAAAVTTVSAGWLKLYVHGDDVEENPNPGTPAFLIEDKDGSVTVYAGEFGDLTKDTYTARVSMTDQDYAHCRLEVSYPQKKCSLWTLQADGVRILSEKSFILPVGQAKKNQEVTAVFYDDAESVRQTDVTLKAVDENGFLTLTGDVEQITRFPAALIDRDDKCVGLITGFREEAVVAFAFDYENFSSVNWLLIGLIALGVLIAAGLICFLILRSRRKNKEDREGAGEAKPMSGPGFPPDPGFPPTVPSAGPIFPPMCFALKATSGIMTGRTYQIRPEEIVTVGQAKLSTICYPESSAEISRYHAEFRFQNGQLTLCDMGSAKGTFLLAAGSTLSPHKLPANTAVTLSPGDVVCFGDTINSFLIEAK